VRVFVLGWAVQNRAAARAVAPVLLRGAAVAAGVAAVLLAYPLYMQFAGPQRYHGTGCRSRSTARGGWIGAGGGGSATCCAGSPPSCSARRSGGTCVWLWRVG
jgi:hypothetical protein